MYLKLCQTHRLQLLKLTTNAVHDGVAVCFLATHTSSVCVLAVWRSDTPVWDRLRPLLP